VKDIGGDVRFGKPPEATGLISGWLHLLLGDEYFADATHVRFKPRSEEDLELLRAYPDLQSLGLYGPGVTDAVLRKLPDVLQLESLQIGSAAISEQGLHALKAQPNLSCIHFTNCEVLKRESPQAMQRLPAYGRFIVAHRRHMLIGQLEQLRKVCSGGGDEVRQRRRVIL
jgi:hypothetical protein